MMSRRPGSARAVSKPAARKPSSKKDRRKKAERRRKLGTGGAVYVEFLMVFLPMLFFFLGLVQLIFLHVANLAVAHAATNAARKSATVLPDDPQYWGGTGQNVVAGARKTAIEDVAKYTLQAVGGEDTADIRITSGGIRGNNTVEVTVDFPCRVPGGSVIACGGASKTLTATAEFPNQGAEYLY